MKMSDEPALLVVQTEVAPEHEARFNRWYNERHIPQRRATPGFASASRWVAVEGGPRYLALYDLESPQTLQTDAYRALSQPPHHLDEDREALGWMQNPRRMVMRQIFPATAKLEPQPAGTGALLVVGLDPQPGYEDEYNDWYNEEHIPWLLPVPGVLRARRFRSIEGEREPHYVAIYELSAPEIRHSGAFERAIDTPWSTRMRKHLTRWTTAIYRPIPTG